MKLIPIINTAFDLARLERLKDREPTIQERISVLIGLDAAVEDLDGALSHGVQNGLARAMGRVGTHQNPNFVELLPFAVQGEKCADLEMPGGNVEPLGNAGPLLQIAEAGPA